MRHFIKETDFTLDEAKQLFDLAADLKARRMEHPLRPLERQTWGLLFFKKSTRTRVSFDVGVHELGGSVITNTASDMQLSRGETVADTAKVLSRYLHGLIIRCYEHDVLEEFVAEGNLPIVNALTDHLHPCQIYSDLFTMAERWAEPGQPLTEALKGRKLAFFGDTACNMANSWILGGAMFGLEIALAGPETFSPGEGVLAELDDDNLPKNFTFTSDPSEAARGADVLYTDVWVSMGKEDEQNQRIETMQPFAVTEDIMAQAKPDAFFMHCLPAHPGLEVTREVLDSEQSIVFDQAENRLHMQKAILSGLVGSFC